MKSYLLLVFAFIVWGETQANDRCSESRITRGTHSCFRSFMANFRIGREEEECSRELKTLEDCLAPVVDECVADDEHRFAVRMKINELKAKIRGTCSNKALDVTQPSSLFCSPRIVERRATNCYSGLLKLIGQDPDTLFPQVCGELKNSEKCLRSLADDCVPSRYLSILERQFKELNGRVNLICTLKDEEDNGDEDDNDEDDSEACMENHKEYIYDCLKENQMRAFTHFFGQPNLNPNDMKCTLYNWISECVTERVEEKCGIKAGRKMRNELNEPTEEIKNACDAVNMKYQY